MLLRVNQRKLFSLVEQRTLTWLYQELVIFIPNKDNSYLSPRVAAYTVRNVKLIKYLQTSENPYKETITELLFNYYTYGQHFISVKYAHSNPDEGLTTSCGRMCVSLMCKTTPVWMHIQLMSEIPHSACPLGGHATRAGLVQKLSSHHTKICQV